MYKFKTTKELNEFLDGRNESNELRRSAMMAMKGTEEVNEYVDESWVLFATNEQEKQEIEAEFHISELTEELEFLVHEDGFDDWIEIIYLFDDSGSGLVYFIKVQNDREN